MMRRLLAASTVLLVAAACGETPSQPSVAVDGLPTASAMADLIPMCHRDAEAGGYSPIRVHPNSETPHRNHGDGQVGDPVPGMEGYEFDGSCQPVPVPISVCFASAVEWYNGHNATEWDWDANGPWGVSGDLPNWFRITSSDGIYRAEVETLTGVQSTCTLAVGPDAFSYTTSFNDFEASKAFLQSLVTQ